MPQAAGLVPVSATRQFFSRRSIRSDWSSSIASLRLGSDELNKDFARISIANSAWATRVAIFDLSSSNSAAAYKSLQFGELDDRSFMGSLLLPTKCCNGRV